MILCPQCSERAFARGGGGLTTTGRTRYYHCRDCDIVFQVDGNGAIRVCEDPLKFRNSREACRTLYRTARDDREWFDGVTSETEDLARLVWREYLIKRRSRAGAKSQISFGVSRRRK